MAITFQKRQRETKRLEKQRAKVERREQKKLAKRAKQELSREGGDIPVESEAQD